MTKFALFLVLATASTAHADPRHGVALEDLAHLAPDSPEGARLVVANDFVRRRGVTDWGTVLSTSFVSSTATTLVIDVVARNLRYPNHGPLSRFGGVGITRVALTFPDAPCPDLERAFRWSAIVDLVGTERWPALKSFFAPAGAAGGCVVRDWTILSEHPALDLAFSVRASLGDILAVVEVPAIGFRRVYPLGMGALDRIRQPGKVTSITATTETGVLRRETSWLEMTFPKHFKGKPYMPLQLPRVRTTNGVEKRTWHGSWIAFHIWQAKGFDREYASHGCMRMRDADLDELAAFLWGLDADIPVVIRPEPLDDVTHPWPRQVGHFWRLQNFGTDDKPRHRTINNTWVTQYVPKAVPGSWWEEVPARDGLIGITIDLR